jgi:hypothetical protein
MFFIKTNKQKEKLTLHWVRKEYILFYELLLRKPAAALHTFANICLSHMLEIASSNLHVQASSIVLLFFFRRFLRGSFGLFLFEKTHCVSSLENNSPSDV